MGLPEADNETYPDTRIRESSPEIVHTNPRQGKVKTNGQRKRSAHPLIPRSRTQRSTEKMFRSSPSTRRCALAKVFNRCQLQMEGLNIICTRYSYASRAPKKKHIVEFNDPLLHWGTERLYWGRIGMICLGSAGYQASDVGIWNCRIPWTSPGGPVIRPSAGVISRHRLVTVSGTCRY